MNRQGNDLLRMVCKYPNDLTPRLIFADWCEENDQPERAAYIRNHIEIRKRNTPVHFLNWVSEQLAGVKDYRFDSPILAKYGTLIDNGFVEEWSGTTEEWWEVGKEIVLTAPIKSVRLVDIQLQEHLSPAPGFGSPSVCWIACIDEVPLINLPRYRTVSDGLFDITRRAIRRARWESGLDDMPEYDEREFDALLVTAN